MRSLSSLGTAAPDDIDVLSQLQQCHPQHVLPGFIDDIPPPLSVNSESVLAALRAFPRAPSPGASQLHSQHLLDAIEGCTFPSSKECLNNLTVLIVFFLSGRADRRIAPWLSGVPLTALVKKQGGIHPIAVSEVLRRLISRLCCWAVKSELPDIFLPYGQIGVGVPGGLDAAVHALSSYITTHGSDPNLCCLKIDMSNAFNECHRSSFLRRLQCDFPSLYGWSQWCYHCEGFLQFGDAWIKSSAGVQQGDPLGPLLFSLALLELLDDIGTSKGINVQLWYLHDGAFVGSRPAIAHLLDILLSRGPSFGLHVNVNKCEIFWPSGDQDFPEFDPEIQRTFRVSCGVDFLGSPVYGSDTYFVSSVSKRIDKIMHQQIQLSVLDDRQVELHLLRSCLGSCKMNHIIRAVPPLKIVDELLRFDDGLRQSFEMLTASSISDQTWLQATLPIHLGGVVLREASRASSAAFIGSCNSSRQLSF